MLRRSTIILFSMLLFSCGKSVDEKTASAVLSANISLSKGNCQAAIDILETNGRQDHDAHYLKVLASAYACRAKFSALTFFTTDIAVSATPAPLGGATKYTYAQLPTSPVLQTDSKFTDLQKAIDILYYAGGFSATTEPTSIERANYFSAHDAAEINSQLVFMMLAQLGKYMEVYADAGTTGVKGSGAASNVCFTDYSNALPGVAAALGAYPGACKVTNSPHAQLDSGSGLVSVSVRRTRLCQGIVLVNGILDILPSVVATAGGGDLAAIAALTANINVYKTNLTTTYPSTAPVAVVLSQANCETDPAITTATIESYFAIIFEALIQ
jgi:hypothetical protein